MHLCLYHVRTRCCKHKACFSYVGKIPEDREFYFLPTIPDFAEISDIRQKSVPDLSDYEFGGKCRRPRRYKFEYPFVGNDGRSLQKSGTRRENRKAPDTPDLSTFITDDREYVRFQVFISRQNLGKSGNSKIPDRLGFSRHMKKKNRLKH